jgi:hypothetical protein
LKQQAGWADRPQLRLPRHPRQGSWHTEPFKREQVFVLWLISSTKREASSSDSSSSPPPRKSTMVAASVAPQRPFRCERSIRRCLSV